MATFIKVKLRVLQLGFYYVISQVMLGSQFLAESKGGLVLVMLAIQLAMPPGTRRITRHTLMTMLLAGIPIDPKYLREYRCPACRKLLAKGRLTTHADVLEVKCRGCSTVCLFQGENAEIIRTRSELLKAGLVPDTEDDQALRSK